MRMPAPASAMVASASSSCCRQSQRSEWKTSPVRHWEWMRTMGGSAPGLAGTMSPSTRAMADSTRRTGGGTWSLRGSGSATTPSKPRMRKCPQRVGKSASASLRTDSKGIFRLYGSGPREAAQEEYRAGALRSEIRVRNMVQGLTHLGVPQVKNSLILITLLVELGVAASFAAILARTTTFKNLLLNPRRSQRQNLAMVAMIAVPLTLGVWIRVYVPNFLAADLSYEATVLMGLLLGPVPAMAGGAMLAIPALAHGEYWTLPANLAVAAIAGGYGEITDREEVWSFSPMIDLSLYRWVTRNLGRSEEHTSEL